MKLKQCIMTASYNYKKAQPITPTGIVVHSTGANNKSLARYVQPLDTDTNAQEILADLGVNSNHNDRNHKLSVTTGVHAFIGLNAAGEVETYQVLPYDKSAFAVGNGTLVIGTKPDGKPQYASYNYNPNARIHFEICEDSLNDKQYLDAVLREAQEYCAYLCQLYGWDVDKICSHREAHAAGYGSNHGDIEHWIGRFGLTMDDFRQEVKRLLD